MSAIACTARYSRKERFPYSRTAYLSPPRGLGVTRPPRNPLDWLLTMPTLPPDLKLLALHFHWLHADSIDHHLRRSVRGDGGIDVRSESPMDVAKSMSAFLALSVWYSLLYVVVEGYRGLGCADPEVDDLLSHADKVSALRRFRNSTFHYQEQPISPKALDFLVPEDTAKWARRLNKALKRFIEREVNVAERSERLMRGFEPL